MKRTLLICVALISATLFGQENQVTLANNMGETPLVDYSVRYDKSSKKYSFPACCAQNDKMSISTFDGMTVVTISRTLESGKIRTSEYYADEEAFTATFIYGYVRGDEEQQQRLKVVEKNMEKRLVIYNNWVYILDWKSRTDWVIKMIYGPGEIKGVKRLKESALAEKNMQAENHKEKLSEYLDKAFAKQDEAVVEWNKNNANKIQLRKDNEQILNAEINGKNEAFWESEEGKAIKRRNELAAEDAKGLVTLTYKGSGSVAFGYESNTWGGSCGNNQSTKLDCSKDIYVYRTVDGVVKRAELVNSAGTNCGGTVEVE